MLDLIVMEKYRVIIHDWDDTITNSFQAYALVFTDFAEYFKLPKPDDKLLRENWSLTVPEIAAGAIEGLSVEEATEKADEFLKKFGLDMYEKNIKAIPKAKETFKKIFETERILGIISNGNRDRIIRNYKKAIGKEVEYHHFIYGYEETVYRKPDPRAFETAMDFIETNYGLGKDTVVYIGDGIHDYAAARDFGIDFFAVTTGVRTKEDFLEAGLEPDFILENFSQIIEKI